MACSAVHFGLSKTSVSQISSKRNVKVLIITAIYILIYLNFRAYGNLGNLKEKSSPASHIVKKSLTEWIINTNFLLKTLKSFTTSKVMPKIMVTTDFMQDTKVCIEEFFLEKMHVIVT